MGLLTKIEYGFCRGLAAHRWMTRALVPYDGKVPQMRVHLFCDN